ncbi:hypothetical protein Dda_5603 [Drechslerella dactyloides]|uniref:Uncharacterized protein n=1 Tax=Drechslerella dactyloides TaxID=74499 RepID=A0AAD6NIV8_DREDA|nr:hypothetical protein Dda_5603 [Drechslerella dactyloides]
MQMSTLINCYVLPAIILYSTLGLSWGIDTTLVPLDDRWGGTDCWVGMYKHGDYEGPSDDKGLEAQPATDGSCIPLDDAHKNAIKSYKVGGDCVCSFYDDSECQIKLFDANRRWDGSLRNNGGNDNKIESYSCQRAPGLSCRLSLWYGCSAADLVKNGYNCGSIWERAPLEGKSSERGEDSG